MKRKKSFSLAEKIERQEREFAEFCALCLRRDAPDVVAAFRRFLDLKLNFMNSARDRTVQILLLRADGSLTKRERRERIEEHEARIAEKIGAIRAYVAENFTDFVGDEPVGVPGLREEELRGIAAFRGLKAFLGLIEEKCRGRNSAEDLASKLTAAIAMYDVAIGEAVKRENIVEVAASSADMTDAAIVPATNGGAYRLLFPDKDSTRELAGMFRQAYFNGLCQLRNKSNAELAETARRSSLTKEKIVKNKDGSVAFFRDGVGVLDPDFVVVEFRSGAFIVRDGVGSFAQFKGERYEKGTLPAPLWSVVHRHVRNGQKSRRENGRLRLAYSKTKAA